MNTTPYPTADASTAKPPTAAATGAGPRRRAIDDPTRALHWLLALSFAGAWLTAEADGWRMVHVSLGYLAAGTLLLRGLWGLIGPRAAAWSAWGRRVVSLPRTRSHGAWQGLAVLLMLALVGLAAGTGVAQDLGASTLSETLRDALGEVHEFAGNTALFAVGAHVALVLFGTVVLKNNRLRAMLTGRVPGRGPDVSPAHRGLAVLVLLAALGFGVWQTLGGDARLGLQAVAAAEQHEHDHDHDE